ncbi:hypothetical protein [Brevundimonas naejangsanensis]|uniref:hypothetical protein n=1 Tax=Brevundimonas naejangsanensis TaxID=588932 RepID=UPI003D04C986
MEIQAGSPAPEGDGQEVQMIASVIASFPKLDALVDANDVVAAGAACLLAQRIIAIRGLCSGEPEGLFWYDVLDPEITHSSPNNILAGNYPRWHVVEVGYGQVSLFGFWFEPEDGSEFQYRYFTDRDQAEAEALMGQVVARSASAGAD